MNNNGLSQIERPKKRQRTGSLSRPTVQLASDAGRLSTDDKEVQPLNSSLLTQNLSQVPINISQMSQTALADGSILEKPYRNLKGNQEYFTTYFSGQRKRPTKVIATVHLSKVGSREKTPKPISLLHEPTNDNGMSNALELGFQGGHILGLSIGGVDESYNVVPMYPGFNRGTWKNVEKDIEKDAKNYKKQKFGVIIDIKYNSEHDTVPQSLSAEGFTNIMDQNIRSSVGKYGTKTQPTDIETTIPLTDDNKEIIIGQNQKEEMLKKAAKYIANDLQDEEGAKTLCQTKHLRVSKKTEYPDKCENRPYEYLDILTFAGQDIQRRPSFMSNANFSADQRKLIIQANMAKNGGHLRSDDINDPQQELSEKGAANFPEIDHIIPKSLGGSNMFSNARVVSWQLNNKEDRVKNISNLIDLKRLPWPTMPTGTIEKKVETIVPVIVLKKQSSVTLSDIFSSLSENYSISLPLSEKWEEAINTVLNKKVQSDEFEYDTDQQTYKIKTA